MTLDTAAKLVGIIVGLTVAITAIRRDGRESRASKQPTGSEDAPRSSWRSFLFIVSVASIAFFTTLITQYVYPPYSVYPPAGYKPLLTPAAIQLLWIVGAGVLLTIVGLPRHFLSAWGAANIRGRVAQAIIIGLALIVAALIIKFR